MSIAFKDKLAAFRAKGYEPTREECYTYPEEGGRVGDGAFQSFKDECDINNILYKHARTGTISHLSKYQGQYGDFTDMPDLLEAQQRLAKGVEIFEELPAEVRREFGNNAGAFFSFVNDPENSDRLRDLLPAIAEPGRYFPNVNTRAPVTGGQAPLARVSSSPSPEGGTEANASSEPSGEG